MEFKNCKSCTDVVDSNNKYYCKYCDNRQKIEDKHRKAEARTKVFKHYSKTNPPSCECCGENKELFLTIDHIEGGGHKLRELGQHTDYEHLIKFGFPSGLRILCYNCNCGRERNNGYCPHKKEFILPEIPPLKNGRKKYQRIRPNKEFVITFAKSKNLYCLIINSNPMIQRAKRIYGGSFKTKEDAEKAFYKNWLGRKYE